METQNVDADQIRSGLYSGVHRVIRGTSGTARLSSAGSDVEESSTGPPV